MFILNNRASFFLVLCRAVCNLAALQSIDFRLLYRLDGLVKLTTMRTNNKRNEILQAAFTVVAEQGANRLTIDAVAAESGVSKGGVLYHFNSKNVLLSGMLAHLVEAIVGRIEDHSNTDPLAAIIETRQGADTEERRSSLALLTAFAEDTRLLEPAREQMTQLYRQSVESKASTEEAATLFFANEGLRFLELFDLCPVGPRKIRSLTQYLVNRAERLQ